MPQKILLIIASFSSLILGFVPDAKAQVNPNLAEELDLDPAIIENSPMLQRWGTEIPNVFEEIRHDPSFRSRLKLGYVQYPSSDDIGGFQVGIEDVFLGKTGVSASVNYSQSFNRDRVHWESDLAFSLFPLGNYLNLAPVVGYHILETATNREEGFNLGLQLRLVLSRTGGADLRLTQSFLSPTTSSEVGITTLAAGYSLTQDFRLGVEIQKQNSPSAKNSRVGILTEWQFP